MSFTKCPRCNDTSFEQLASHDYCASCNYSSEFVQVEGPPIPEWAQRLADDPGEQLEDFIAQAETAADRDIYITIETLSVRKESAAQSAHQLIHGNPFQIYEPSVA